jgi:alpha-tubulin suppressor-like RCC1 family protein
LLTAIVATLSVSVAASAQTAAGGVYHSLVLKSDGTLWAFGYNGEGELGDGTWTSRSTPVQVSGLTDIVAVAAGEYHSMAITSTGALYVWGYNGNGQVGDASTTNRNTPTESALTNVVAIAAGKRHSLALRSNGDIYAWGLNSSGQLGTGNTTQQTSPVLVATGGAALGAGGDHSIFVKSDGAVYTTGYNNFGALGDGTTTQRTSTGPDAGHQHGGQGGGRPVPHAGVAQRWHGESGGLQQQWRTWRWHHHQSLDGGGRFGSDQRHGARRRTVSLARLAVGWDPQRVGL